MKMDRKFFALLIFFSIILGGIAYAGVSYPVAELGNCQNEAACKTYCDDINNIDACISAAEKYGMMTAEEIADVKMILPYLKAGTTPGGCKSKEECDAFCNKDENINECIDFAVKIGEIDASEAEIVKKTGGKGPGGCKGKKQCDDYCNKDENINECIDFAVANGFISAEEAEIVKKTGGKGPGGCKKDECDSYCQDDAHIEECIDFAVKYGMMDAKDAEMAKKTKGKGPGGCKSKEECDAFCKNPDNMETCTNFAIENGLGTPEELENMKNNQEFMQSSEGQCYSSCLKNAGAGFSDCPEGGGGAPACEECSNQCFQHENQNCLSQERWQQLDADCRAKGSGYHLEDVKGDNGRGEECVVDMTCVYSSGEEWESQEEKDRKMAEMEQQWERDRAEYEQSHGPGGSENTGEGYSGGCTEPGPEGQCNPGPGAGGSDTPAEGSGGGTPEGEGDGNSGGGGESSGGGESVVTGEVISEQENFGIIQRIVNFFLRLTGRAVEEHSIGPSQEEQNCMMSCMKCSSIGVNCTGNQESCISQCNAKKPEASEETGCMEECVIKGCGEYDFSCQNNNKELCEAECGMIKEPPAKSEEEQCIRDCVNAEQEGLICGGGEGGEKGNELCQRCAKSCEHLYAGPCLDEMKLEAKKKECMTCEHCYAKPVMGDSGEGYQCIVNVECADASSEFGDEPGTGPGIGQEGFIANVGNTVGNVVESIGNFFRDLFSSEDKQENN